MANKSKVKKVLPKSAKKRTNYKKIITELTTLITLAIIYVITGVVIHINVENGKINATITYSNEGKPAVLYNDKGELIETTEYNGVEIPTVDEVDGGLFEDTSNDVSYNEDKYSDLGSAIETFPTTTPEIFSDSTLGLCIYASNRFGAQCVSLARSFWISYSGRDVSTCGTGMAKGMMNCYEENAGDDFFVYWGSNGIQDGDWIVSDGGQYGHVCMALGHVVGGYVACLGENQGGKQCEKGGAATNIINFNVKNVIGYYRPKAYVIPEPTPEPTPSSDTYTVKKGDTLGDIARNLGWYTGDKLFGDNGYTQKLAESNGILNRGLIYPEQIIKRL